MKKFLGCLLTLTALAVGTVLLIVLAFILYLLFHIVLYFLPCVVAIAILLSIPYFIYQFFKGMSE